MLSENIEKDRIYCNNYFAEIFGILDLNSNNASEAGLMSKADRGCMLDSFGLNPFWANRPTDINRTANSIFFIELPRVFC